MFNQNLTIQERFERKLAARLKAINQPIEIIDILVTQDTVSNAKPWPISEYNNPNIYQDKYSHLERIKDTIALLCDLANQHHKMRQYNQNNNSASNKNFITRLVMNELSFFTADRPLTYQEFRHIISFVEGFAFTMQDNIHLLLSSFAIQDDLGEIYNVVVYVQSGTKPQIDYFAKACAWFDSCIQYKTGKLAHHRQVQLLDFDMSIRYDDLIELLEKNIKDLNQLNTLIDELKISFPLCAEDLTTLQADANTATPAEIITKLEKTMASMRKIYITNAPPTPILPYQADPPVNNNNNTIHNDLIAETGMNHGGVVICKTNNNAKFITLVDICADYRLDGGMRKLKKYLEMHAKDNTLEFLPIQASHVLTSNTLSGKSIKSNLANVLQVDADPVNSGLIKAKDHKLIQEISSMSEKEFAKLTTHASMTTNKYPNTSFSLNNNVIRIVNPPFGRNLSLRFLPKRSLEQLTDIPNYPLESLVKQHNETVKTQHSKIFFEKMQTPTISTAPRI